MISGLMLLCHMRELRIVEFVTNTNRQYFTQRTWKGEYFQACERKVKWL